MATSDIYPHLLLSVGTPPVANIQITGKTPERDHDLNFRDNPEVIAAAMIFYLVQLRQITTIMSQFGEDIREQAERAREEHHSRLMRKRQEESTRIEGEKRSLAQRVQVRFAQRQALYLRSWGGSYQENRHLSLPV